MTGKPPTDVPIVETAPLVSVLLGVTDGVGLGVSILTVGLGVADGVCGRLLLIK